MLNIDKNIVNYVIITKIKLLKFVSFCLQLSIKI